MSTIPFSSGSVLSLLPQGTITTAPLVAFGTSVDIGVIGGSNIDLTGSVQGDLLNMAFSNPQNGNITALSGFFSVVSVPYLNTPIDLVAQIYTSTTNLFTPVGAPLLLGTITSPVLAPGLILKATTGLNIPVAAGERILLVFYATSASKLLSGVVGYASAGIKLT